MALSKDMGIMTTLEVHTKYASQRQADRNKAHKTHHMHTNYSKTVPKRPIIKHDVHRETNEDIYIYILQTE